MELFKINSRVYFAQFNSYTITVHMLFCLLVLAPNKAASALVLRTRVKSSKKLKKRKIWIGSMASSPTEGSTFPMDDYETLLSTTDVELLKRAWRNEKAAPEILRFETDLINRIKEQIQLMVCPNPINPLYWNLYKIQFETEMLLLFLCIIHLRLSVPELKLQIF